jgi:hypothetical protein
VKPLVAGFQIFAAALGSSQPSHRRTSPVWSSVACTATSGQFITGVHRPVSAAGSVFEASTTTAAEASLFDASRATAEIVCGPFPTLLLCHEAA